MNQTTANSADRGVIPNDPNQENERDAQEEDNAARARYIAEFRRLEAEIVQGANGSEQERETTLIKVENALLATEYDTDFEIEEIARQLEGKLEQLIDALRGNLRGLERNKRVKREVPADLATEEQLRYLLRNPAPRERRLLLCGRLESALYEYRDQGRALVKSKCVKKINQLREQASKLTATANDLMGHLLVSQMATEFGLRPDVSDTLAKIAAMVDRLDAVTIRRDPASLRSLLEANGDQVRNQFNVACASACLYTYGNVSVEHLRRLQTLKSFDYVEHLRPEFRNSAAGAADERRMTRYILESLRKAQDLARKRKLAIEPILAFYKLDPALGALPETRSTAVTAA